jgi:phage shock protein E
MSRTRFLSALAFIVPLAAAAAATPPVEPPNPRIDMAAYLKLADEAAIHRETRRISEAEFIRMSRQPGTIVLDARSRERYEQLHVKGAVHLSFPDIAIESLAETLPDKNARILIYCNNNFENGGTAFLRKSVDLSLNLSTFIALYGYGYRNVYELGPLLDLETTRIEFESSRFGAR